MASKSDLRELVEHLHTKGKIKNTPADSATYKDLFELARKHVDKDTTLDDYLATARKEKGGKTIEVKSTEVKNAPSTHRSEVAASHQRIDVAAPNLNIYLPQQEVTVRHNLWAVVGQRALGWSNGFLMGMLVTTVFFLSRMLPA